VRTTLDNIYPIVQGGSIRESEIQSTWIGGVGLERERETNSGKFPVAEIVVRICYCKKLPYPKECS